MNNTILVTPFLDKINACYGIFVAILTYILGESWFVFAAFLLLNVIDYMTGVLKSKIAHKENSTKGYIGVLKKLGYWLMIMVAFLASAVFIEIGEIIGINLGISTLIGWFVLASLIINEFRSILENFVEAGYDVPDILTNGLEVASKVVKNKGDTSDESDDK